uniref:Uncharacterized protein n=1 Tax=Romanomermis culicivorax TaxID=13658 RepID=A0A915JG83_ROMCU
MRCGRRSVVVVWKIGGGCGVIKIALGCGCGGKIAAGVGKIGARRRSTKNADAGSFSGCVCAWTIGVKTGVISCVKTVRGAGDFKTLNWSLDVGGGGASPLRQRCGCGDAGPAIIGSTSGSVAKKNFTRKNFQFKTKNPFSPNNTSISSLSVVVVFNSGQKSRTSATGSSFFDVSKLEIFNAAGDNLTSSNLETKSIFSKTSSFSSSKFRRLAKIRFSKIVRLMAGNFSNIDSRDS